jgi:branched-chain amino acid transport system substrate-binding protein
MLGSAAAWAQIPSPDAMPSAATSQAIRLGAVAPLSGEAERFGLSTWNGYAMAVAEWNAKGGVLGRQIILTVADDFGDPAEGARAFEKLISQDKVVAIVGPVMSKVALAGAPLCQAAHIPLLCPTCTHPRVTQTGDYIFRACFIDPVQGRFGAHFIFKNLKAKRAACLFDPGNDYTRGLAEAFRTTFTTLGGKVVGFEGHPTGATDFSVQLKRVLAFHPGVLYVPDYYNDAALIALQARELGFKGPLVGGDGWDSPQLIEVGGRAVEGCFLTNHYCEADPSPIVQTFVASYQTVYGSTPDALAALAYDSANLMLDAIRRAGSTQGEAIKSALQQTNFITVTGRVQFDRNRNPVKPGVVMAIVDGRQVFRTSINP